jgi:hypothetical protein
MITLVNVSDAKGNVVFHGTLKKWYNWFHKRNSVFKAGKVLHVQVYKAHLIENFRAIKI